MVSLLAKKGEMSWRSYFSPLELAEKHREEGIFKGIWLKTCNESRKKPKTQRLSLSLLRKQKYRAVWASLVSGSAGQPFAVAGWPPGAPSEGGVS